MEVYKEIAHFPFALIFLVFTVFQNIHTSKYLLRRRPTANWRLEAFLESHQKDAAAGEKKNQKQLIGCRLSSPATPPLGFFGVFLSNFTSDHLTPLSWR